MTTHTSALEGAAPVRAGRADASLSFDWLMVGLGAWFSGGVLVDIWAHTHGRVDESFFTPWHAILYSGFFANAIALTVITVRNRGQGYDWRQAIPSGYELSAIGVPVFMAGGVGDMLWHIAFGVEDSIEALLSPTHLLLAVAMLLIVSGPLRAAYRRRAEGQPLPSLLPLIFSMTFAVMLISNFTVYAHPFNEAIPTERVFLTNPPSWDGVWEALGIGGSLLHTALLTGAALYLIRRWPRLPFGAFTLLFSLTSITVAISHDQWRVVPVYALTGLLGDGLLRWTQPGPERVMAFRVFAFSVSAALYLAYFVLILLTDSVWWSVHMWAGTVFMNGLAGLLLSYAFVPPGADSR